MQICLHVAAVNVTSSQMSLNQIHMANLAVQNRQPSQNGALDGGTCLSHQEQQVVSRIKGLAQEMWLEQVDSDFRNVSGEY